MGKQTTLFDIIDKEDDFDFLLTCPPYGFLEVYSKDPNDLSNMTTENFNISYRDIIKKSCDKLNDNRFAAIVVGEYRDKQTTGYVDFIGTTVDAFRQAGLNYYNELILINVPGSAPLRVGGYFYKGRKIAKTHQNILVFVKGDHTLATEYLGKVTGVDLMSDKNSDQNDNL